MKKKSKPIKAGVYVTQGNNIAILYPDRTVQVWVDDSDSVYLKPNDWAEFEASYWYLKYVKWELLWPL